MVKIYRLTFEMSVKINEEFPGDYDEEISREFIESWPQIIQCLKDNPGAILEFIKRRFLELHLLQDSDIVDFISLLDIKDYDEIMLPIAQKMSIIPFNCLLKLFYGAASNDNRLESIRDNEFAFFLDQFNPGEFTRGSLEEIGVTPGSSLPCNEMDKDVSIINQSQQALKDNGVLG
jgi:hypothetical protein